MSEVDLSIIEQIVADHGVDESATVPILQAIQRHYRYLPQEALQRVCELTDITPANIMGVASFHDHFRHRPMGRHLIRVCHGTACHVKGAERIDAAVRHHLQLNGDRDTDESGEYTVQKVACVGCCTLAPVVQFDDRTYGYLTPERCPDVFRDFVETARNGDHHAGGPVEVEGAAGEVRVGLGSCCVAKGSHRLFDELRSSAAELNLPITVKRVGCVGMCHQTPLVEVQAPDQEPVLYTRVGVDEARDIVLRHFRPRRLFPRVRAWVDTALEQLLSDDHWTPVTSYARDVRDPDVSAFLGHQMRIATEHFGEIDPLSIDDYFRVGGFQALRRAVNEGTSGELIDLVDRSGIRGRGGAGFPTGRKWREVAAAPGERKFIICNGDEGDPGAFMDRMILESLPFRVIEGMALAAYAVGASEAFLFIRAEYPLAVERVQQALAVCDQRGLLGEEMFGEGRSLHMSVKEGAGGFICGEETALMESIEGRRAIPRLRPPFPAHRGLWGCPTLVNNVETFATLPWIVRHGAEEYAKLGTDGSHGTKVFALAGKVMRGGLIEVPMGITIREVVEEIGGGIESGREFKAVQIGGPSGGCVPAELADTPIDYESLSAVGAIMGSGGLVVLDDGDCMVDVARYFLRFTQTESCGQCTFCRVGTRRMLDILEDLCAGRGSAGDLTELEQLATQVNQGSLCGLGQTAPNPVLSTLRHFRDEYEAHLDGRCPAGRCHTLITYSVTAECNGCTLCAQHCPYDAIELTPYRQHEIDVDLCERCDICRSVCPADAIEVV